MNIIFKQILFQFWNLCELWNTFFQLQPKLWINFPVRLLKMVEIQFYSKIIVKCKKRNFFGCCIPRDEYVILNATIFFQKACSFASALNQQNCLGLSESFFPWTYFSIFCTTCLAVYSICCSGQPCLSSVARIVQTRVEVSSILEILSRQFRDLLPGAAVFIGCFVHGTHFLRW